MEEKISGIIVKHLLTSSGGVDAAKEITTHVMEFIEWKDNKVKRCLGGWTFKFARKVEPRFKSYEEIYQYWIDNIKK